MRKATQFGIAAVLVAMVTWLALQNRANREPYDSRRATTANDAERQGSAQAAAPAPDSAQRHPAQRTANGVTFVDERTLEPIAIPVLVTPLRLPTEPEPRRFSAAALEAAGCAPGIHTIAGQIERSSLPAETTALLVAAEGYSTVLLPTSALTEQIALSPLAHLDVRVSMPAGLTLPDPVTLHADPVDPATGAELPTGFWWRGQRCSPRQAVHREVCPTEPITLQLEPGAYRLFLSDQQDHPLWRCDAVTGMAPGSLVLECRTLACLRVTVSAPTENAMVWFACPDGSQHELPFAADGVTSIPTTDLADGTYRLGAVGNGWVADPGQFSVANGIGEPKQITLQARSAQIAIVDCLGLPDGTRFEVARVQDGTMGRGLTANPNHEGLALFRHTRGIGVVGVPDTPLDLVVVAVTRQGSQAQGITVMGPATYQLAFTDHQTRTATNIVDFVRSIVERHGRGAITFTLQAGVRLGGGRVVWVTVTTRDFLGGPDPLAADAWTCTVDIEGQDHRVVAHSHFDNPPQLLASTAVTWSGR